MSKGGCGGRVGKVVCWHVDALNCCDGTVLGGADPFLKLAHVSSQSRLVTDGGGHTSEKGGNFRARLGESEDVVDEEHNVHVHLIAEILGDGQSCQATRARAPGGSFI